MVKPTLEPVVIARYNRLFLRVGLLMGVCIHDAFKVKMVKMVKMAV